MEEQETYHLPVSGADGQIPTPSGLPEEAREIFEMAFEDALRMECTEAANPRKCATQKAWAKVNEKYYQTEGGDFVQRSPISKLAYKHYGPGPHSGTGTPQSVHGSGGGPSASVSGSDRPWASTPKEAKDAVKEAFAQFDVPHGKLSARKVSFMDLARAEVYNVTVKDIDWQTWLDAGPKEIKAAMPKKVLLEPKFINVPEGTYIATSQYRSPFTDFIGKSLAEDFGMKITDPLAFQQRREFSRQKRKKLAKSGKALPWGGYPIENCTDVKNAVQAIGRAKDRSRTIAHIKKHAKRLGCSHLIPKKWNGGESEEKSVAAMEEKKFLDDENRLAMAAKSAGIDYNALLKRRSIRAKAAAEDQAMLEAGYGDCLARRPDDISSNEWANLPFEQRTVGAVVWRRHCIRKYDEAVEDAVLRGWKAEKNKFRPEEWIFKTWVDTPDGWQLVRAILVRSHGEDTWRMKEISRGASLSVAIRVGPDEVRR